MRLLKLYQHSNGMIDIPRLFKLLCVVCLLLTSVSCSRPVIGRFDSDTVLLAFGDSLTYGTGAGQTESYPAVLSGILGCTVINGGKPGEVSADGLARLPAELEKYKPDLVIICHGGNDFLGKIGESEVAGNIDRMAALCRQLDIEVVIVATPKPGILLRAPGFYRDVARKHGVPVENKLIAQVLSKSHLKSDYIHPNARGYKLIAEGMGVFLREHQQ